MSDFKMRIPEIVLVNTKTGTTRKFKALKRKQMKQVRQALDKYSSGCAYAPCLVEVKLIYELIDSCIEKQNVTNWGR
jgi:hypothetical protein